MISYFKKMTSYKKLICKYKFEILKKNTLEDLHCPILRLTVNLQSRQCAIGAKTDTQVSGREEGLEVDLHINDQLILNRSAEVIQWKHTICLTNGIGTIGHPLKQKTTQALPHNMYNNKQKWVIVESRRQN